MIICYLFIFVEGWGRRIDEIWAVVTYVWLIVNIYPECKFYTYRAFIVRCGWSLISGRTTWPRILFRVWAVFTNNLSAIHALVSIVCQRYVCCREECVRVIMLFWNELPLYDRSVKVRADNCTDVPSAAPFLQSVFYLSHTLHSLVVLSFFSLVSLFLTVSQFTLVRFFPCHLLFISLSLSFSFPSSPIVPLICLSVFSVCFFLLYAFRNFYFSFSFFFPTYFPIATSLILPLTFPHELTSNAERERERNSFTDEDKARWSSHHMKK